MSSHREKSPGIRTSGEQECLAPAQGLWSDSLELWPFQGKMGKYDDQLMDFAGAARGRSAWQSLKPYLIFNLSHRDRSWWNWCKAINPIEFDTLKSALRFTLSFLLSRFLHKLLMLREFLDHFQAHEWRPTYVEITWKSSTSCSGDFLNVKRGKPPLKVGRASVKVQGPGGRWRSHCSRL